LEAQTLCSLSKTGGKDCTGHTSKPQSFGNSGVGPDAVIVRIEKASRAVPSRCGAASAWEKCLKGKGYGETSIRSKMGMPQLGGQARAARHEKHQRAEQTPEDKKDCRVAARAPQCLGGMPTGPLERKGKSGTANSKAHFRPNARNDRGEGGEKVSALQRRT